MKTLIVPSNSFRNVYSAVYYFAETWAALGNDVRFFVRILKPDRDYYRGLAYPVYCSVYNPQLSVPRRKLDALWFRARLAARLAAAECWVVVDSRYLPLVARMKRLLPGRRIVHYCQELQLPEEYPNIREARWAERYARIPDIVIETNPDRARIRKDRFQLREEPKVLLNTAPRRWIDRISPHPDVARYLPTNHRSKEAPVVFYAGGIGREKPFTRLIDALTQIRQPFRFLALCNAGRQEIEPLTQFAARRLAAGSFAIHPAVEREEAIAIMKHCDVGLIDYSCNVENTSNQRYASPTKLFEYMGCGLAVAATYNVSVAGVIDDAVCGAYGREGEVSDLVGALQRLLSDRELLVKCKRNSRKAFEERYCYELACEPVIRRIHEDIAARNAAPVR